MKSTTHLIEHVLQTLLRQRRAFYVLDSAKLPGKPLALLARDRPLLLSCQLLYYLGIIPQIDLRSDDKARHAGTVVVHFGEPLLLDVLERCWRGHTETNEEDVRLGVRQWTQAVVIFLACIWSR